MLLRALLSISAVLSILLSAAQAHHHNWGVAIVHACLAVVYVAILGLVAKPFLDLWIDIGLLQVSTTLNKTCDISETDEHLSLQLTILNRWGIRFRLYKPNK